jgi:hypothetical protein
MELNHDIMQEAVSSSVMRHHSHPIQLQEVEQPLSALPAAIPYPLGSRTIISYTTVPELTSSEFARILDTAMSQQHQKDPYGSLWFHFEGRNIGEVGG